MHVKIETSDFNCIFFFLLRLDVHLSSDSNIPQIAQELMKKMITTFAKEYASKCLLHTNTNGVTRTSSPLSDASEASDAPLDLTVNRTQEENTIEGRERI